MKTAAPAFILGKMFTAQSLICSAVLLILISSYLPAVRASSYIFENVFDMNTPSPVGPLQYESVALSNGTVAFRATYDEGQAGIFTAHGGTVATIAKDGDAAPGGVFRSFSLPSISNGQVAFRGEVYPPGSGSFEDGIFVSEGSSLMRIVHLGDPVPGGTIGCCLGTPSIRNGAIGFRANYYQGSNHYQGVFIHKAGGLTRIAATGDEIGGGTIGGAAESFHGESVAVDGEGLTFIDSTRTAVFRGDGESLDFISVRFDPAPLYTMAEFLPPAVISGENVAFSAAYGDYPNYHFQGLGIFRGNGAALATIVTRGSAAPIGSFDGFGGFSIQGDTIAFAGYYAENNEPAGGGIFTGNGGPLDSVIETGDELFGGILQGIQLGSHGFDSNGDIAFTYSLTDGRYGVAIAHRPLQGDFNRDGTVDAADYAVWRKNSGGMYTQDDYTAWRANFGQSVFNGSAYNATGHSNASSNESSAVPEPGTFALVLLGILLMSFCWRGANYEFASLKRLM